MRLSPVGENAAMMPLPSAFRSSSDSELLLLTMNCLNGYFHFPYFIGCCDCGGSDGTCQMLNKFSLTQRWIAP